MTIGMDTPITSPGLAVTAFLLSLATAAGDTARAEDELRRMIRYVAPGEHEDVVDE